MLRIRRNTHDFRIEIMPLIDVIFLLLTFFIYAMVLMVRAELLPVEMHAFASGEPGADVAPLFGDLDFDDVLAFLVAFGAGCQ